MAHSKKDDERPGRRADGEGSIYEIARTYPLADGSTRTKIYWCAEIRWREPDGSPSRASAQRSTKSAAREWLARKRIEIGSGTAARADERRVTVGDALDQWLGAKSALVRHSTNTVYKAARKHLATLDAQRVVMLTRDDVRLCIDREALSVRMRIIMRMVLRASLRPYERVIREELFPRGSAPRVRRKRMQVWTPAQAAAFMRHTSQTRLGLLWRTGLLTGMRRGELLALRWCDVHDGRIEVTGSLDAMRNLVAPKTNSSHRPIDIDPGLDSVLKNLRGKPDEFVFKTVNDTCLSPRNVLRDFRAAIVAANEAEAADAQRTGRRPVVIPAIRFHDLRHTHATMLLRANVHPKIVSERLGHSSVQITLDIYSHAVPTLQTRAAVVAANMLCVGVSRSKRSRSAKAGAGKRKRAA